MTGVLKGELIWTHRENNAQRMEGEIKGRHPRGKNTPDWQPANTDSEEAAGPILPPSP